MSVQKCEHCAAPLKLGPPGTVVKCAFCGTDNRIEGGAPDGPARPPTSTPPASLGGAWIAAGVLIAALALAGVLAARRASGPRGWSLPGSSASPGAERLPLARLAEPGRRGTALLDAPGMPGTLRRFDPIVALPWIHAIARAWAPDATLRYAQFSRVARDGTIDLAAAGTEAHYQFTSPARVAAYQARAATDDREENWQLIVLVHDEGPRVVWVYGRPQPEPLPSTTPCPLGPLLESAINAGALVPRPGYTVYLHGDGLGAFRWQISHDQGSYREAATPCGTNGSARP